MYTYPDAFADATTAEALAFLKSPTLLARRFAEIVAARGFISHKVLSGRWNMQGGALLIWGDERIEADEAAEDIAPGAEYPLLALSPDQLRIVESLKQGFGNFVADEAVGRQQMDPIERGLDLLANRLIGDFEALSLSLVGSSITETVSGGAWTDGGQIIGDVAKAKATVKGQRLGYTADAVLLTDMQWAEISEPLLDVLPRESRNPAESGNFPNFMGLTWLTSSDLPDNWEPIVFDSKNLGGIGHESIPSPEYVSRKIGDGTSVEIARYREKRDGTTVQVRKTDVPVVRNALAGVAISGTGL